MDVGQVDMLEETWWNNVNDEKTRTDNSGACCSNLAPLIKSSTGLDA